MKKIKFGLLSRVVLAIVLGVALGSFVPAPFVRVVNTVSAATGIDKAEVNVHVSGIAFEK